MESFRDFLDYAEGFYYKAEEASRKGNIRELESNIMASILFSWCGVESFINNMMADFAALPEDMFSLPERALLTECALEFATSGTEAGQFRVSDRLEYKRLEDKIMFLVAKFGRDGVLDKGQRLWQEFEKVKEKRNAITHPRLYNELTLTLDDGMGAVRVAKGVIQMVSNKVWRKKVEF